MSISSVSNSINLQSSLMSDAFKQRKQDFTALARALQSGDLAGAQKAFATLQQDKQSFDPAPGQTLGEHGSSNGIVAQASQSSQSSQGGTTSMQDLMSQLKQALSAGDLQGAQQAFASLQQKIPASQAQGHHHHHHGGVGQPGSPNTTSAASSITVSSTTQASGFSTTA